jgi:methylated-DNA-[protein]-cysteine S-methyltransferase
MPRPYNSGVVRHRYAVDGWGVGEVIVAGGMVVAHELPDPSLALEEEAPRVPASGLVDRLVERVRAHLAGTRAAYDDIPLELSWCTAFQRELASAIREVPWGEIVSYGELAALAGRPGAARAAGTFCARNPFALVFPCHRVVSSTGIGGYGSAGLGLKRRLLALEGIEL